MDAGFWRAGRRRLLAASASLSLLAGCVQGPDYEKPQVDVPAAYRSATILSPSEIPDHWWTGYGDRHLDTLVTEALTNNHDLRIATARVDEFAAVLAGTKSQAYPQVGYGLSGNRARASEEKIPAIVNPLSTTWSSLLSASWEIDLWGRIRRETEAARANLLASEEARQGVTLTLISSVIIGYITLLDLDEQLRVSEATVAGRAKSVDVFEKRLAAGWVSEFEMAQVRGEYEQALASLPPLRQAIVQQENAVSVLVGRNPGPIERATPEEIANYRGMTIPAGIPSELLTRRPDIRQAEQQLIASNALIGAARALFFPQITLTGLFGFASGSLGSLFSGPAHTWSFTGDVAGPIYTGGGITAAVDQAIARRDQSLANYEKVIQNAFRDVDDALVAVKQSAEFRDALGRRVATLRHGVELANERYENGYSDYLEVLDTERSLFNAELQYASARGDYQRALVNLYRALGGDWTTLPPSMAGAAQSGGSKK